MRGGETIGFTSKKLVILIYFSLAIIGTILLIHLFPTALFYNKWYGFKYRFIIYFLRENKFLYSKAPWTFTLTDVNNYPGLELLVVALSKFTKMSPSFFLNSFPLPFLLVTSSVYLFFRRVFKNSEKAFFGGLLAGYEFVQFPPARYGLGTSESEFSIALLALFVWLIIELKIKVRIYRIILFIIGLIVVSIMDPVGSCLIPIMLIFGISAFLLLNYKSERKIQLSLVSLLSISITALVINSLRYKPFLGTLILRIPALSKIIKQYTTPSPNTLLEKAFFISLAGPLFPIREVSYTRGAIELSPLTSNPYPYSLTYILIKSLIIGIYISLITITLARSLMKIYRKKKGLSEVDETILFLSAAALPTFGLLFAYNFLLIRILYWNILLIVALFLYTFNKNPRRVLAIITIFFISVNAFNLSMSPYVNLDRYSNYEVQGAEWFIGKHVTGLILSDARMANLIFAVSGNDHIAYPIDELDKNNWRYGFFYSKSKEVLEYSLSMVPVEYIVITRNMVEIGAFWNINLNEPIPKEQVDLYLSCSATELVYENEDVLIFKNTLFECPR